jgi:quinol monooxygenase YgiN
VATIKTVPGKREEYLKHLKARPTLILVPQEQADTVMLYEVHASREAFKAHWTGPSKQQANRDWEDLKVSASGVRCDVGE